MAFSVEIGGRTHHGTAPKVTLDTGGVWLTIQGTDTAPAVLWVEPAQPNQGRLNNQGRTIRLKLTDGSYQVEGGNP